MEAKKITPTAPRERVGATRKFLIGYKGTKYLLSEQQHSTFNMLKNGYGATVRQISQRAIISHPNAVIRDLRHKGIRVLDRWEQYPEKKSRYKRFYLNPSDCNEAEEEEGKPSFTNVDSVEG